jgi:hypothetical protein
MISQNKIWRPRGRPPSSRRIKAEDLPFIDVRNLGHASKGQFVPFHKTVLQSGRIPPDAPLSSRTVEVTIDLPSGERRQMHLELGATRQLHGVRQWLVCGCGRRARKLFSPDPRMSFFACRRCLRLVYTSQYLSRHPLAVFLRRMRRHCPDLFLRWRF